MKNTDEWRTEWINCVKKRLELTNKNCWTDAFWIGRLASPMKPKKINLDLELRNEMNNFVIVEKSTKTGVWLNFTESGSVLTIEGNLVKNLSKYTFI